MAKHLAYLLVDMVYIFGEKLLSMFIHFYLRAVGRKVLWSSACVCLCVCLSVCLCVRTVFVRKISQERVDGSPPNLVGGSRG